MTRRPGPWWRLWIGGTVAWGALVLLFFVTNPYRFNPLIWNEPRFQGVTPAQRVVAESGMRRSWDEVGVMVWAVPPVVVLGLTLLTLTLRREIRSREARA